MSHSSWRTTTTADGRRNIPTLTVAELIAIGEAAGLLPEALKNRVLDTHNENAGRSILLSHLRHHLHATSARFTLDTANSRNHVDLGANHASPSSAPPAWLLAHPGALTTPSDGSTIKP